tara:strand:- start:55 stop:1107 length:1053 start_codon:yes stop_codon:yes gene_type:complete
VETFGGIGDLQAIQGGLDPSGRTSGTAPTQQEQDDYAEAVASIIAAPIAGDRVGRSNIINASNYDPRFAAALDISRGLDPTRNFGGTGGLAVPSYLRPQIEGSRGPLAPKYSSQGERFFQEILPNITQNIGIMPLISKLGDKIFSSSGTTPIKTATDSPNILDKIKEDFIAAGKGVKRDFSKLTDLAAGAFNYLTNPAGGTSTTDTTNINMNQDRPSFISDFEVTRTEPGPPSMIPQRSDMMGIAGVLPEENKKDMEDNIGFTPMGDPIKLIDRSPSPVTREVIDRSLNPIRRNMEDNIVSTPLDRSLNPIRRDTTNPEVLLTMKIMQDQNVDFETAYAKAREQMGLPYF